MNTGGVILNYYYYYCSYHHHHHQELIGSFKRLKSVAPSALESTLSWKYNEVAWLHNLGLATVGIILAVADGCEESCSVGGKIKLRRYKTTTHPPPPVKRKQHYQFGAIICSLQITLII